MNKIRNDVTYAIKALMYLYENQQFKTIKASEISESEDIPINFLYTILRKLKEFNYIEITPGIKGGYKLRDCINEITLLDLITIISGDLTMENCYIKNKKCNRYNECKIGKEFKRVENILKKELSENKLIDLLKSK